MNPPPLPGVYVQLYRGAYRGSDKRAQMDRHVAQLAVLGLPGVVFHGFPRELATAWDGLAKLAHDHGIQAVAAWGLDGSIDSDQSLLTAAEKGQLCGSVLAKPSCAAGLLDAEGQWDVDKGGDDQTDEHGALILGEELRRVAPNAVVGDQPWFAIDSHGDVRRQAKPLGDGGVFAGFPVDEFAVRAVNWFRFRQCYCNNFKGQFGEERYAKIFAWMDRDWARITPAMKAAGLDVPLGITIQGYGWRLRDLVHCLVKYVAQLRQPVVMWAEPFPEPSALAAIRALNRLQQLNYARAGVDPREAVRLYQRDFNKTAIVKLDEDGWCGLKTLTSMGIVPA